MAEKMNISLDFWNTLGIPNPIYAKKRNEWLASTCKCGNEEIIKKVYNGLKEEIDERVEKYGSAMKPEWCAALLRDYIESWESAHSIKSKFEQLFSDYPPIILSETKAAIRKLKKKGFTFNLASNTNFISGKTIRPFLKSEGFGFPMFFSDELGISKPHKDFFSHLPDNTIHIGDNEICDYDGAAIAGHDSILIKNANELPAILLSLI